MKQGILSRIGATSEQAQYEEMTGAPVRRLILKLSLPSIVSMLVSALYNMADTFFVSQLGTSASGAVGIVFSLMAIIQAIGFTLGTGSGSLVSRMLGAKEHDEANSYVTSAFFAALAFGLLLTVSGLCFLTPLLRLLGATETILPYARDYGKFILVGAPFMCASFVMNVNLRYQGRAALSMLGLATGGILNIALDPLFIFTFGLGTAGASLATLISQCVSFSILLSMYIRKRSLALIAPNYLSRRLKTYLAILRNGVPSLCRQGLASASAVLLNTAAGAYGDAAIAAMAIVNRVYMFVTYIATGIGQGTQPVYGYNYGAGRYDRVRQAFGFMVGIASVLVGAAAIACMTFAPELITLFRRDDPAVIAVGTPALRFASVALFTAPFITGANMMLQATGQSASAAMLACCRQGIFFLPLILTLPGLLGVRGIEMAQPIADLLTALASLPLVLAFFSRMRRREQEGTADSADRPDAERLCGE